jgi:hypothetical protein
MLGEHSTQAMQYFGALKIIIIIVYIPESDSVGTSVDRIPTTWVDYVVNVVRRSHNKKFVVYAA